MRQKLKRAMSGMLSIAMITSALLTDFTPPAFAEEVKSVDVSAGASGSVTSNYIAANLNGDSGQEAAALNEEAITQMLLSQMEMVSAVSLYSAEDELISASGNDVDKASINDYVAQDDIKELVDEVIADMDDITPAADYDENGLAPTYHYITLNYSLVEKSAVWTGMTINDIWEKVPDAFVASYLTTLSVYTQEGNEDYFVAMANPAALNGLGNAIYADFTDGNTEDPAIYNDRITFDAETGLIYIPKSFYFNESGEEVLRQLEAQLLVPYSFVDDTTSISVTSSSEIEGVTALTGKAETAALDVTITVPVVDQKDADQISIEDLYVTVNNDFLPFDLTNGGGFYDQKTGELTLAAAGNTVYAVDVKIKEDAAKEAQASAAEKEVLIASVGDLSGIIARDLPFYGDINYATDAASMKTLPGVNVTANGVVRGQTYTYTGAYEYVNNYNSANTDNASKIITNTARYCYYYISGGSATAVDGSNMGGVNADGTVTIKNLSSGSTALLNTAKPDSTFNRIAELPKNTSLTSSDGAGTLDWECNITGNPSGYSNHVALHCVASATSSTGIASGTGNLTIRVLYYKAATSATIGYMVFSVTSPTAYTQAGCAVYKIQIKEPDDYYYARFGINKVSSTNSSAKLAAYFAYDVTTTDPAYNKAGNLNIEGNLSSSERYAASLAEAYKNGTLTTTGVTSMLYNYFEGTFVTSTSGVGLVTLNSDTCTALANCGGNPIYVKLAEVIPAEGYIRKTGVWVLKITPSGEKASYSTLNSVTYYSYNANTNSLNAGTSVSKTSYYFTVTNIPETYYARVGFDKYEYDADNTAGSRLSGAVIGIAGSEAQAQAGALMGGTSYASKTITTSSSSAVYYQASLGQGIFKTTIYAYEASAPSGYTRNNGYWKINVQGVTDTSGFGTKIISAVYYTYSSSSGKWNSYEVGTTAYYDRLRGWYTQGSDTVIPIVHVTDKKQTYYYRFGANKYNLSKTKLDGAEFTVSTGLSNVTSTGCTQSGTTWTLTPSSTAGSYITAYSSASSTMTFYVKETKAPDGYAANTGLWAVKMSGTTNSNGNASSITKVTYFPAGTPTSAGYTLSSRDSSTGDGSLNVGVTDGYYLGDYRNMGTSAADYLAVININYAEHSVEKLFANEGTKAAVTNITAELYRNGTATGKTVTLNSGNNWKYTWTNLDKYDGSGKAYTYTVKEIKVNGSSDLSGYTVTYDNSKTSITSITNELAGRPELPVTGGVGTTIFYIIAILALIAAIIFVFKGRRAGSKMNGKRKGDN